MLKEINLKASMAYNDDDFRDTVEAFSNGQYLGQITENDKANDIPGKFKGAERMITSRIHLEDVVEKGFKELITNKDKHVKILVTPRRIVDREIAA